MHWLVAALLLTSMGVFFDEPFLRAPDDQAARNPTRLSVSELQLSTTITKQRYCSDQTVQLHIRPKYTNFANTNVILFKYGAVQYQYSASRTEKAALAGTHEVVISPMLGFAGQNDPNFTGEPDPTLFTILKPGQSYVANDTILLFSLSDGKTGLRAGKHFLRLHASPWPWPTGIGSTEELRARWDHLGRLWTKDILSDPMEFTVVLDHTQPLSNCNVP
jgi:hypothetical protein